MGLRKPSDGTFEDVRMIIEATDRCPLRRVLREAIKIKDVKEKEEEIQKVVVNNIEKEIRYKLKLLNTKTNEFYLPTSVATDVIGISEMF